MTAYLGQTEPVAAGNVQIGDRLVHDKDERGFLVVTGRRDEGGEVLLPFDNGEDAGHADGQRLWKVVAP